MRAPGYLCSPGSVSVPQLVLTLWLVVSQEMVDRPTALERAFQLAKSGSCASIDDIKRQLKAEGFSLEQLTGSALSKQLRDLMISSNGKS
jgi:hypothetical protein